MTDPLDGIRTELAALDGVPVDGHVAVIARALDVVVGELDDLARTTPSVR